MDTIKLDAVVENVVTATDFVDARLEEAGCPLKAQMQLDIVIDEIFSNIAKFAYAPGKGQAEVSVEIEEDPKAAVVTFADSGMPYNPLAVDDPDITLPVEQRQIGGLGILIVKKTMDDVYYEHRDGKNILSVRKEF